MRIRRSAGRIHGLRRFLFAGRSAVPAGAACGLSEAQRWWFRYAQGWGVFPAALIFCAFLMSLGGCGGNAASAPPATRQLDQDVQPAATPSPGDMGAFVDSLANAAVSEGGSVGLSIAVALGDEIIHAAGYGYGELEQGVSAGPETVFRIGSITKQFTAAAIMRLEEQGKLSLEDDLNDFVKDFPTHGHRVTVEQLLNHTSGITSFTSMGSTWRQVQPLPATHREMLELMAGEPFVFAPGTRYQYNNSGYYLLGVIIEQVSGKSYEEYLTEEFFGPLGLERTSYCWTDRVIPDRAAGYATVGGRVVNAGSVHMSRPYAAGALCSTVTDLIRWKQALVGGRVVRPETYARMIEATTLADGRRQAYGYGLALGRLGPYVAVQHSGSINGFVSMMSHYPERELTVAVLSNTSGGGASRLARQIAERVMRDRAWSAWSREAQN